MSLLTNSVRFFFRQRLKQLDSTYLHPEAAQEKVFANLLMSGKQTAFGKQYNFQQIQSIPQFQQQVPIQEYEAIVPYVNRIRKGEQKVLWNTPVRWLAKSSGTTANKSKYIPVTQESLYDCHYRAARDVVLTYLRNYPRSKILSGKGLTLGGSHQLDEEPNGIRHGDLSAIMIYNSPWYSELARTPKQEITLIPDFELKIARIAKEVISQNITNFSGVPSWNLVLMKKILDVSGKKNLLEVWPNLELFMHGGIPFEPYRELYRQLIPSNQMHYMETYNASEGFFALQENPADNCMTLLSDVGIFYEFLPLNRLADALAGNFTALDTVSTVKTNIHYAMVISTNGGLWRYLIGDTIMFTSLFPHKIKITGRTRHYINVFGEELIMENAAKALQRACEKTGACVCNYTVAPIFMDNSAKGAHQWIVEFDRPPANTEEFVDTLDRAICEVNSDYEAKRANNTTLNRLTLTEVTKGTFYEWMRQRGKLGGQNKIPCLYNTREYAEELLKIKLI